MKMIENEYDNDQRSEINTKNWFGPAIASMARLNQIQANVHNMGFHSAASLKAHRGIKHRSKPPLPTDALSQRPPSPASHWEVNEHEHSSAHETQNEDQISYTDLQPTPPLSTTSYQRSAWGSNHSIPELIAQQGKKMTRLRPSSAKGQTGKLRPPSKGRPQSAKEPLCSDRNDKNVKGITVSGQRKTMMSTRPPSRGSVPSPNSNPAGFMDHSSQHHQNGAWAGPPAGHVMEHEIHVQDVEAGLTVPPSSPEPAETEGHDDVIGVCPQTPPLLRKPLPQPIHLSLPSVSESVDVAMEDFQQANDDDMDTQRLLIQAELFVDQQKIQEEEEAEKERMSRITSLPEHIDSTECEDKNDVSEFVEKGNGISITLKSSEDYSQPQSGRRSKNKQKHSIFLSPDENHSYQPLTLIEESKNVKTRAKSATLRKSKENVQLSTKGGGVKIREDRNITVDITPRNIGRKVNDDVTSFMRKQENRSNNNNNMKQDSLGLNKKINKSLVSTVNVEYLSEIDEPSSEKIKNRKTKTMGEVETMISQLSKLNSADDNDGDSIININDGLLMSQVLHKSEGEKNYFEISRSQSRLSDYSTSTISERDKTLDKDGSVVYKTTKTIEFDQDNLKENSTKRAINSQVVFSKPKVNAKQKYPLFTSPILPSSIKQQKNIESHGKTNVGADKTNVETKFQTETGIDELANMLKEAKTMAVTSLYDATKRRPPSGKKNTLNTNTVLTETKLRPASAAPKLQSTTHLNKYKTNSNDKPPKSYPNYMTRTGSSNCCRSAKSVKYTKPVVIKSLKPSTPFKTPESDHCKKVQSRMAELGVDVDARLLEKALFAPAGEPLYYEVSGNLPKNPSEGLLSHYKYWLPEDYKRIQIMEKRLAQDDHIRYLQKLAAEKKAKKAAEKESKGKKKKKKKLVRSNSIV